VKTGAADAASAEVLRTMDPDLWFTKSRDDLKQNFQAELKACNDDSTIEFLSVLLIANMKLSVSQKHAKAIVYMEKRVSFTPDWRKTFLEAVDALKNAEARYQNQPNLEEARDGLEKAQQALRQTENEFSNFQNRKRGDTRETGETRKLGGTKNVVSLLFDLLKGVGYHLTYFPPWPGTRISMQADESAKSEPKHSETSSTTYYFQILTAESLEKVFGHVLARLIRGIKSKSTFVVKPRENVLASRQSTTISNGGAQVDGWQGELVGPDYFELMRA
jgi:hypothetical protein